MRHKNQKLRNWELALLLALCLTLCAGALASSDLQTLSGGVVRLHVIANSDTPADQAAKLRMRDRVLALLTPALADCATRQEAVDTIRGCLPALEDLGCTSVTLGREYYPTRRYGDFALPAGEYVSLRVVLGEGRGHNWWCVVFPPLCTEALAEGAEDAFLSLDGDSAALITMDGTEYELRFRLAEWWGRLFGSSVRSPASGADPASPDPASP